MIVRSVDQGWTVVFHTSHGLLAQRIASCLEVARQLPYWFETQVAIGVLFALRNNDLSSLRAPDACSPIENRSRWSDCDWASAQADQPTHSVAFFVDFPHMLSSSQPIAKNALLEIVAVLLLVLLLILTGVLTWRSIATLQRNREIVRHTHSVILAIERIESAMKDAATGQRGFLITGRDEYLQPFENALEQIDELVEEAKSLTIDNAKQNGRISLMESLIAEQIDQLRIATEARREGGFELAQKTINTDVGMRIMDRIRLATGELRETENELLAGREEVAQNYYRTGLLTSVLSTLLALGMVAAVLYLIQHNRRRSVRAAIALQAEKENLRVTLLSIGDAVAQLQNHAAYAISRSAPTAH